MVAILSRPQCFNWYWDKYSRKPYIMCMTFCEPFCKWHCIYGSKCMQWNRPISLRKCGVFNGTNYSKGLGDNIYLQRQQIHTLTIRGWADRYEKSGDNLDLMITFHPVNKNDVHDRCQATIWTTAIYHQTRTGKNCYITPFETAVVPN